MGVESSSYKLTLCASPQVIASSDLDYLMFQILKEVPNAKDYLNEDGKPTGNGGTWDDIPGDFKAFSRKHPDFLFYVEEQYDYEETHYARHYIKNGKSQTLEPVMAWPDFSEDDLT